MKEQRKDRGDANETRRVRTGCDGKGQLMNLHVEANEFIRGVVWCRLDGDEG